MMAVAARLVAAIDTNMAPPMWSIVRSRDMVSNPGFKNVKKSNMTSTATRAVEEWSLSLSISN